jgi:hypothetical protein
MYSNDQQLAARMWPAEVTSAARKSFRPHLIYATQFEVRCDNDWLKCISHNFKSLIAAYFLQNISEKVRYRASESRSRIVKNNGNFRN